MLGLRALQRKSKSSIFFVHISIYSRFGLDTRMVKYYGNRLYSTNRKDEEAEAVAMMKYVEANTKSNRPDCL
jgi:hypothetical protein